MPEIKNKLRCLPAPDKSMYRNGNAIANENISLQTPKPKEEKITVYGRDLNHSDILLLNVNEPLKKVVCDEYGIGSRFTWEYPLAFSTTSKKVIIDDGKQKYFVKEKPKYCCNPYNLSLSSKFQEFLSKQTDFVPNIVHVKSGESYLRYGGSFFFTTEYKHGRMFNASVQDVENAGAVLGKIHTLSQKFKFIDQRNIQAHEDTLEFIDLANTLNGAESDEWRVETVNTLRSMVDEYKDRVDDGVEYIANHCDYAPFNLVYDDSGKIIAVNDFDNVNYRPRTRDIAGAILSFCDGLSYAGATSSLRKPIATSINVEKVNAFLDGYFSNACVLTKNEKDNLIGEIMIRWVKIMALGIVRGDFNYQDVLKASCFKAFVEEKLP